MTPRAIVSAVALLAGGGLAAFVGFVGWQYHGVTHLPQERPPLPEGLVALDSDEGRALLATATAKADADALIAAFAPQEQLHWAGVATVSTIRTAATGSRVPQASFYTPATDAVRPWWKITFTGMTLEDLGGMFEAHGAAAEVVHADAGIAAFRAELARNLATPGDYLAVNYHRAPLGQGGTGNIAPVAAWNEAADRVLVLDGAAFRGAPAWIETEALFAAMDTVDGEVDQKRGWVVVR